MQIYSSIVLGSFLLAGLTTNFQSVEYRSDKLQQSNVVQHQLLANGSESCQQTQPSYNESSPIPGCGRRKE